MAQTAKGRMAQAEQRFKAQDWTQALLEYAAVLQAVPEAGRARMRIGDCLLNLEQPEAAVDVYRATAWAYLRGGYPLQALSAAKLVSLLDPSEAELLEVIAEMYASASDRIDPELPLVPPPVPGEQPCPAPPASLAEAVQLGKRLDGAGEPPPRLPSIPLFSHLSERRFVEALRHLRLVRVEDGAPVVREGDRGASFFMLAEGQVGVFKATETGPLRLATLSAGSVFGEMALVSDAPRAATAQAEGEVDLLEMSRAALEALAGESSSVTSALRRFTRARLLANLAATSVLFNKLEPAEQRALMSAFKLRGVFPGDILIEEGERGPGLFLALSGSYTVTAAVDGAPQPIAELGPGDVFGEISLIQDTPTVASVTVQHAGELLFLPREVFAEVLKTHPQLAQTLAEMSEHRLRERAALEEILVVDEDMIML